MKKTFFILTIFVLLLLLAGCGKFEIEGEVVTESTPTVSSGDEINQEVSSTDGLISPSNEPSSPAVRLGLLEIMCILGVLVLASLAIGAFFIVRDRTPASDYPPSADAGHEKKGIGQLLRFKPTVGSLILALIGWAGIFGFGAILLAISLLLPVSSSRVSWSPTLTVPSSILIGANPNEAYIRFVPGEAACGLRPISDQDQQLHCDVAFEGAPLAVDVELRDGVFWYCSAAYDGGSVPCFASFDNNDYQTYIVVQSDLGLSQERFQQLVDETSNAGWGENDWIWLARGIVGVISLIVFGLLWRHTGNQITRQSGSSFILRVVYSGGISLMIFAIGSFVSFILLLAFNLID